jgi:hypothetical protein
MFNDYSEIYHSEYSGFTIYKCSGSNNFWIAKDEQGNKFRADILKDVNRLIREYKEKL